MQRTPRALNVEALRAQADLVRLYEGRACVLAVLDDALVTRLLRLRAGAADFLLRLLLCAGGRGCQVRRRRHVWGGGARGVDGMHGEDEGLNAKV